MNKKFQEVHWTDFSHKITINSLCKAEITKLKEITRQNSTENPNREMLKIQKLELLTKWAATGQKPSRNNIKTIKTINNIIEPLNDNLIC